MPTESRSSTHEFADRFFRRQLRQPEILAELVSAVAPDVAARLDFRQVEAMSGEFLRDDLKRQCDCLLRVPFRTKSPPRDVLVWILVEHQSRTDAAMPLRSLFYAALTWENEWAQAQLRSPGRRRLSHIIPIVFHTGQTRWRNPRQLADMFEPVDELARFLPKWEPLLFDVATRTVESLLSAKGPWERSLAVVRAVGQPVMEYLSVVRQVCQSLAGLSASQWRQMIQWVVTW